jgi:recombination protein RecT
MSNEAVKARFIEILGKKAQGFISSVINAVNTSTELMKADANSIMMCAVVAATLDLPIDRNLGFSYIIPYSGKAQFQIGYKGFIQLAMRTGQYKTINAVEVYEGELIEFNKFSGEAKFKQDGKTSDKVVGYYAMFELLNGFRKELFWPTDKITSHAKKFSKTYNSNFSVWKNEPDAMGIKTVLKNLLSKYGYLTIELQTAVKYDQSTITDVDSEQFEYAEAVEEKPFNPDEVEAKRV